MFAIIGVIAAVTAILAACHILCNAEKIAVALLRAAGWGFLVYHSDSQKYFYSLSYRDALEWVECSLGDAAIFKNWNKEVLSVKLV